MNQRDFNRARILGQPAPRSNFEGMSAREKAVQEAFKQCCGVWEKYELNLFEAGVCAQALTDAVNRKLGDKPLEIDAEALIQRMLGGH